MVGTRSKRILSISSEAGNGKVENPSGDSSRSSKKQKVTPSRAAGLDNPLSNVSRSCTTQRVTRSGAAGVHVPSDHSLRSSQRLTVFRPRRAGVDAFSVDSSRSSKELRVTRASLAVVDAPSGHSSRSSREIKVSRTRAAAKIVKPKSSNCDRADFEVVSENSADNNDVAQSSDNEDEGTVLHETGAKQRRVTRGSVCKVQETPSSIKKRITLTCRFLGKPFSRAEAMRRWPHRYEINFKELPEDDTPHRRKNSRSSEANDVKCVGHYSRAEVDSHSVELGDCVLVNADSPTAYVGKIVEIFELADRRKWLRLQWFFRAEDTVLGTDGLEHDRKRIFYSDHMDDNPLDCVLGKLKIIRIPLPPRFEVSKRIIPPCDYYYDMGYNTAYSTFYELSEGIEADNSEEVSTVENNEELTSVRCDARSHRLRKNERTMGSRNIELNSEKTVGSQKSSQCVSELLLLDLYSGCGGMSTGLCMGAELAGVTLVSKWAVDLNTYACASLKHNHPETEVRNESAEDFLALLKVWQKLCQRYSSDAQETESRESENVDADAELSEEDEYEVEKITNIRWNPSPKLLFKAVKGKSVPGMDKGEQSSLVGLEYKVRWKGYTEADDTWEPATHLIGSQDCIRKFVVEGKKKKILPLPGDCDVICGGPPCQGISGFNRFRNTSEPLKCGRNRQIIVYMDIVQFLKPRFVLMENVVDILKFANGMLARYALSRLIKMHYQAKLGLLVAGCYGLPQFRMRFFLWGTAPGERLPPFPLPTHIVVLRGYPPKDWEMNVVAYDEDETPKLEDPMFLYDVLSDLPEIKNSDKKDEMYYDKAPETKFQRLIRLPKHVHGRKLKPTGNNSKPVLYDHRAVELNTDDYQRVCQIPKRKGANFRDLDGVVTLPDGTAKIDSKNRRTLPSGKPLVPDYCFTFGGGKSVKPFGRMWWDETVGTVTTLAEPRSQSLIHPNQDRILSIRECARLQGFPDFYKLFGPVKERYTQVGNAVAVPVARALGFGLGQSIKLLTKASQELHFPKCALVQLPDDFPFSLFRSVNGAGARSGR